MKLPDWLFVLINPAVRLLLLSPCHRLLSKSVMLIRFRGRNSGKTFVTPVRYIRVGPKLICFTGKENQWWRNMRVPVELVLRAGGVEGPYRVQAIHSDPSKVKEGLALLLAQFPQDAPYYDIKISRKEGPDLNCLESASYKTAMIECYPVT